MTNELLKQAEVWRLSLYKCPKELRLPSERTRLIDEAEALISALAKELRRSDSLIQRLEGEGLLWEVMGAIYAPNSDKIERSMRLSYEDEETLKSCEEQAQAAIKVIKGKL